MELGMVGKSDFKENPKSDLDLDLEFVNIRQLLKITDQYRSSQFITSWLHVVLLRDSGRW